MTTFSFPNKIHLVHRSWFFQFQLPGVRSRAKKEVKWSVPPLDPQIKAVYTRTGEELTRTSTRLGPSRFQKQKKEPEAVEQRTFCYPPPWPKNSIKTWCWTAASHKQRLILVQERGPRRTKQRQASYSYVGQKPFPQDEQKAENREQHIQSSHREAPAHINI